MALENYRDLSRNANDMSAGFEFEFYCNNCSRTWSSGFKPYRLGMAATVFSRLLMFAKGVNNQVRYATNSLGDIGRRRAYDSALADAMERAEALYTVCPTCKKEVCGDCFDADEGQCIACVERSRGGARPGSASAGAAGSVAACPNCQTPSSGGRFCAECGFDMASTHKSCPSCGAMTLRQARFCTDCGHSF